MLNKRTKAPIRERRDRAYVYLFPEHRGILDQLASMDGDTRSGLLRRLIREEARRLGLQCEEG